MNAVIVCPECEKGILVRAFWEGSDVPVETCNHCAQILIPVESLDAFEKFLDSKEEMEFPGYETKIT